MQTQWKAGLWLVATFAVGTVFGMVLNGALARPGVRPIPPAGVSAGFVAEMERLIEPRDNQQRELLRPLLQHTDESNRAIVDGARIAMAAALDSLRIATAPLLDSAQRRRLAEFSGPPDGERAPGLGGRRGSPPKFDGRAGPPPNGRPDGPLPGGPPRGGPPPERPR